MTASARAAPPGPSRRAASRLLASALRGGRAYLALFLGVHIWLAGTSTGFTAAAVAELVLIGGTAVVLATRRRLGPRGAAGCILGLVAAAAIGTWSLPIDGTAGGYAAWHLGAITFVLLGFTLVDRVFEAWSTLACVAGIAIAWAVTTGQGPAAGIALVDRHVATLLVGTLFAVSLRRSNRRAALLHDGRRRRVAAEQAADARRGARRSGAEAVLGQAGPMLRAIADGRPFSPADRAELLVLEGALRDRIRTPDLARPPLVEAVAAARRRGVNVLLLDECDLARAPLGAPAAAEARAWLAEAVAGAAGRRFVGRVREQDGALRVTAVTDGSSRSLVIPLQPVPAAGPGPR